MKKTKDSNAEGATGSGGGGEGESAERKSDDGAEVPAVDDGDNVAPTIVEGQLKPEIPEAMESASQPATDESAEQQKEVITGNREKPAANGDESDRKKNEIPSEDSAAATNIDKRPAKASSPSAAALLAQEILSPVMSPLTESYGPYVPPTAVEAGDMNALQELDERKIIELREAFNLFDLDHDGCIDAADIKSTFQTLGVEDLPDDFIAQMLSDAMDPLDFESFVLMYGMKTIEMDPEEVLLEALGKWDKERTGQISIER